jgi:hypothetical protein
MESSWQGRDIIKARCRYPQQLIHTLASFVHEVDRLCRLPCFMFSLVGAGNTKTSVSASNPYSLAVSRALLSTR